MAGKSTDVTKSSNSNKASWIAVCSILLGLLTVASGLFTTNTTLRINSEKEKLETEVAKENELNKAMVDIREFLILEQEECVNGQYKGDSKGLRNQLIKLSFAIVNANMTADEIFDLALLRKVQSFTALIYENKNICAQDFPKESDLIKLHREINLDMRKFTDKTRQNIKKLGSGFFTLL